MADYTTFIPREFFSSRITSVHIFVTIIIILMLVLIGYKIHEATNKRKKPESF